MTLINGNIPNIVRDTLGYDIWYTNSATCASHSYVDLFYDYSQTGKYPKALLGFATSSGLVFVVECNIIEASQTLHMRLYSNLEYDSPVSGRASVSIVNR